MRDEDLGDISHRLPHVADAFLLEEDVADAQRLIDQQHLRLETGGGGERQTDDHAAGIGLGRLVDEIADVRKRGDFVEFRVGLPPAHTADGRIQIDVLTPRKVRIEAAAKLEHGGNAADDGDLALTRRQRPSEQLQERALA
nr:MULTISPECIES: hypothetical protein [unclassified Bradyrhizobium]